MHKFVLWIFEGLRNIEKFLKLLCLFYIMIMCLYWAQDIIGASWKWLVFFSPIMDPILNFVNSIYSFSFDFWGKTIEIKYFNAVILVFIVIGCLHLVDIALDNLQELYESTHKLCKKVNEDLYNKTLQYDVENEQKKIKKYMVFIKTRVERKYLNKAAKIDLDEQNRNMNKFISEHLKIAPVELWDGFLYFFDDFEKIDRTIDILYRILNSHAPLEYLICIQAGNDTKNLKKLAELQEWEKIIISADTLCRYEFNRYHKYKTTNLGIFQREEGSLEVHEIVENL